MVADIGQGPSAAPFTKLRKMLGVSLIKKSLTNNMWLYGECGYTSVGSKHL